MALVDILYIVLIVAVIVLTVILVIVLFDLRNFLHSSKKAADDASRIAEDVEGSLNRVTHSINNVADVVDDIVTMAKNLKQRFEDKMSGMAEGAGMAAGIVRAVRDAGQEENKNKRRKEE